MQPKVSFVIPCYKLAHFLAACVSSILAQTYRDFEVLIMDDCSPDNTAEIASGFKDPRVRYLRNEVNLGHIRNFNKGIELARGRYIWLISADDSLRRQNVLQKFVGLLDENPQIGYVFCPAISLRDGEDIGVEGWTNWPGDRDRILSGREILVRSLTDCPVCAPAGLVRKECYTRLGLFPINLPRSGDHFLWAAFATVYDAGYFSEPMVHYRHHATNMDHTMSIENPSLYFEQELLVIWMIKKELLKAGINDLIRDYQRRLAELYARMVVFQEAMNLEYGYSRIVAQREVAANASGEKEARVIIEMMHEVLPARLTSGYTQTGISYYKLGDLKQAIASFRSALAVNPWSLNPRIYLFSSLLERICGIRLIPLLKLLKNTLQRSLTQSW